MLDDPGLVEFLRHREFPFVFEEELFGASAYDYGSSAARQQLKQTWQPLRDEVDGFVLKACKAKLAEVMPLELVPLIEAIPKATTTAAWEDLLLQPGCSPEPHRLPTPPALARSRH